MTGTSVLRRWSSRAVMPVFPPARTDVALRALMERKNTGCLAAFADVSGSTESFGFMVSPVSTIKEIDEALNEAMTSNQFAWDGDDDASDAVVGDDLGIESGDTAAVGHFMPAAQPDYEGKRDARRLMGRRSLETRSNIRSIRPPSGSSGG